ncbi:uncharacterized protein LOC121102305 [Ursus maritimus]|uniref:Uncharacterized protein LOC121102305 n=1 Tax=Ursus maritimus TaxID=29073 RepID=A0A8M1FNU0_URSMA|nr:uncharacterized protein LOC121102305 [Ursus maritimus]
MANKGGIRRSKGRHSAQATPVVSLRVPHPRRLCASEGAKIPKPALELLTRGGGEPGSRGRPRKHAPLTLWTVRAAAPHSVTCGVPLAPEVSLRTRSVLSRALSKHSFSRQRAPEHWPLERPLPAPVPPGCGGRSRERGAPGNPVALPAAGPALCEVWAPRLEEEARARAGRRRRRRSGSRSGAGTRAGAGSSLLNHRQVAVAQDTTDGGGGGRDQKLSPRMLETYLNI